MFDAMDVGLLSFLLVVVAKEWALLPSDLGLIGSVNALGMAVGALFFGMLSDRIGRKAVFMWTLLLFSCASGLSALATGFVSFVVLRFFLGMGLGGELPVAATYVSEVMPAHERGRAVVLLESFWALGWIVAALLAYFVLPVIGWRAVLALCALPAFYTLYLRKALPDSTVTRSKSSFKTIGILWSPLYRQRSFVLWTLWFIVVFSYYGMFLWLPSVMVKQGFDVIKSFGYVLLMSLAQLPGYFTVAYLIERIGRKKVLALFLLGTAASAFVFAISKAALKSGRMVADFWI